MADLRTGAVILKEFVDLEDEKAARHATSKKEEKAVAEAAANKVIMTLHFASGLFHHPLSGEIGIHG